MRLVFGMIFAACLAVATAFAQTTALQPRVTATTLTLVAGQQIIGSNPTRRSIRICNTGASNPVWIWPGALSPVVSHYILAPVTSNVISCYTPPVGINSSTGNSWNATAVTSGAGTASVEEW